jgi:hypothetical protein
MPREMNVGIHANNILTISGFSPTNLGMLSGLSRALGARAVSYFLLQSYACTSLMNFPSTGFQRVKRSPARQSSAVDSLLHMGVE